jgi:Zn finger protein HypA/HybF involved in hydrogenase expression
MCTVGGAPTGDLNFDDDRVKGKRFRCNDCEEKFTHINPNKKPICPGCESDNVTEI